ncbi:MAG: MBL fold metallo-hydrolase [Candidatus Anstonellales archaeon]
MNDILTNNLNVKLIFLGNGGGRTIIATNFTSTGGFVISYNQKLLVCEPGIQSFDNFHKMKLDIKAIDGIIVSHNHLDHVHDLTRYLEACDFLAKKKPFLLASRNVLVGDNRYDKYLSSYHAKKAEYIVGEANNEYQIGDFKIRTTKIKHDEYTGFGFVVHVGTKKIGYTSDSEFFKGFAEQFNNCDCLIVNNLKPENDGIPDHLCTNDTIELLKIAKPKMVILYHLGMSMFKKGVKSEIEKIEKETKIDVLAAEPCMIVDV